MKPTKLLLPLALAASLFAINASAAPTVNTVGGGTSVALSPEFTAGVEKLGVKLSPSFPALPMHGRGGDGGGDKPLMALRDPRSRGKVCGIEIPDIPGYPIPEIPKEICDWLGKIIQPKMGSKISITGESGFQMRPASSGILFPIASGEVDLKGGKGEISHVGGINLKSDKVSVNLSSFVIDTTGNSPVLTGLTKSNDNLIGRIVLFDMAVKGAPPTLRPTGGRTGKLQLSADLTLSAEAAAALNELFGVTAFEKGIPVGAANVATLTFDPDKRGGGDKPDGKHPGG